MKKITDNSFHYTPSFATDIRKSFRRIKAAQKAHDITAGSAVKQQSSSSVISIEARQLAEKVRA